MSQKRAHNFDDITGKKFGKLTVIELVTVEKKRPVWRCLCDCGNEKITHGISLKRGGTKSCGCILATKDSTKFHNFSGFKELSGTVFNSIRGGAKARNLDFNITQEYIYNLFISQEKKCKLTGLDLEIRPTSQKKNIKRTASLDRIDSSKGYIEGNVQWIHVIVNKMKWDLSTDEFLDWCKKICQHMKQ